MTQAVKAFKPKILRNQRLLLQVGAIVTVIFLVITLASGTLVYQGGKKVYLKAKNEMIEKDLLRVKDSTLKIRHLAWLLDYCEEEQETITRLVEGETEITDADQKLVTGYFENDEIVSQIILNTDKLTDDQIKQAPADVQESIAKYCFQTMLANFYFTEYSSNYDKMYCIDLNEKYFGFVYCRIDNDNTDEIFYGEEWNYPLDKHPVAKDIMDGEYDENTAQFELAEVDDGDDSDAGVEYYIGYVPIVLDGNVRCVVCLSFDWSGFRAAYMPYIILIYGVGLAVIVIAAGILLLYLHRAAISPLKTIQSGVRKYMNDKDSKAIVEQLSTVRSKNELGVLSDDISALAMEIHRYYEENIRLATEQEKSAAELGLAAKIQSDMLPKEFPDRPEFELYASMTPAKEVGGDFYDFFMIDDDHLGLVVADVSGKGVPASLFMMMSMIVVRNLARSGKSPAEALSRANAGICENNDDSMFVTVWFGVLELSTGHVVAANGGHEYPIIGRADGGFELFKDRHGFVLGGVPDMKYREYAFDLNRGDTLFLYTDGAPEATDADTQLFTTERMIDALNRASDSSPRGLIENMTAEINAFVGDAPQFDDLTMMCVRYKGLQKDPAEKQ